MKYQESDRYIVIDGKELCRCKNHDTFLPCEEFYPRIKSATGYDYNCKQCMIDRSRVHKQNRKPWGELNDNEAREHILKSMGYNTNSEDSIHQQFLKKYHDRI